MQEDYQRIRCNQEWCSDQAASFEARRGPLPPFRKLLSLSLSLSSIMSPFFPSKSSNASSASSSTKPRSLYRCGEKKVFKFDVLLPLLRMLIVPLGAQTSRLLAVIF